MGDERRDAVRRQVRCIIERCLKLEWPLTTDPRLRWKISVDHARSEIADSMTATIRRSVEQQLPRLYRDARRVASKALAELGEQDAARSLPTDCPYELADLLAYDLYAANRCGIVDADLGAVFRTLGRS